MEPGAYSLLAPADPEASRHRRALREVPANGAWAVPDSNRRPPACKAGALPAELTAPAAQSRAAPRAPSTIPPVSSKLFWRALATQGIAVALLFAILALALPHRFFHDWGFIVGPAAWIICTLLSARLLPVATTLVAFAAVAGGVAGAIVFVVANHWVGLLAGLLVFAASCAASMEGGEPPQRAPDAAATSDGD
jgi:hypothetical protein